MGQGRASGNGIPILFPFPNRIRQGCFRWDGRDYQLSEQTVPFDNTGNAIHGLCLDRAWRVIEHSDAHVVGEFQLSRDAPDRLNSWPSDFVLQVGYRLRHNLLRGSYRIQNPGPTPLPWGLGTHPYFRLPLGGDSHADDCLIQAPATRQWVLDDCLPSGERIDIPAAHDLRDGSRFGDVTLDHVLSGLESHAGRLECQLMDSAAGLQITQTADSCFRELVVYTPPR
ncbi:MAG: aldose 1-epimerase, partial [Planctomycetaceae bacterium]